MAQQERAAVLERFCAGWRFAAGGYSCGEKKLNESGFA